MDILYLLIPLSLVLVFLIGAVFWWSLRSGQFDDLEGPAHRILQDDDERTARARRRDRYGVIERRDRRGVTGAA